MSNLHINYRRQLYQDFIKQKRYGKLVGLTGVELNVTELCNRKCVFCPRHNPKVYQNRDLHMNFDTIEKIVEQLLINEYTGVIYFSGFGEPFLNPNIIDYILYIKSKIPDCYIDISTNGDFLTEEKILKVKDYVDNVVVDCYDSEEQRNSRIQLYESLNFKNYKIRDLWVKNDTVIDQNFYTELNFSNRSGAVTNTIFDIPTNRKCYMPFYRITIDWNGKIVLCCNDWFRQQDDLGSIHETPFYNIWFSDILQQIRNNLQCSKRVDKACKNCSATGTLFGYESQQLLAQNK